MKHYIICLVLLHLFMSGISQDMGYVVQGTYARSVKKAELNEAKTMKDINPGYPSSWITDYVSAEILVTYHGQVAKAIGPNETLSTEQRSILGAADIGSNVVMDVKYKKKNAITGIAEIDTMIYSVRIVPEVEAEYIGGYDQMTKYLEENAFNAMTELNAKQPQLATIKFTVNEDGKIIDAQISSTSEDEAIDKLLLEAIQRMPKWKPAEDANGMKVKQEFEFIIGSGDNC